jgi:hypothetical protein
MRNVSDKICTENQNTNSVFGNFFFENREVYEILLENIVERGRPLMAIWRICIVRGIPKTTNKPSQYVIRNNVICNNGYGNALPRYAIRTLNVMFRFKAFFSDNRI